MKWGIGIPSAPSNFISTVHSQFCSSRECSTGPVKVGFIIVLISCSIALVLVLFLVFIFSFQFVFCVFVCLNVHKIEFWRIVNAWCILVEYNVIKTRQDAHFMHTYNNTILRSRDMTNDTPRSEFSILVMLFHLLRSVYRRNCGRFVFQTINQSVNRWRSFAAWLMLCVSNWKRCQCSVPFWRQTLPPK